MNECAEQLEALHQSPHVTQYMIYFRELFGLTGNKTYKQLSRAHRHEWLGRSTRDAWSLILRDYPYKGSGNLLNDLDVLIFANPTLFGSVVQFYF